MKPFRYISITATLLLFCSLSAFCLISYRNKCLYYPNVFHVTVHINVLAITLLILAVLFSLQSRKKAGISVKKQVCMLLVLSCFFPNIPVDFIRWYAQKREALRHVKYDDSLVIQPETRDDGKVVYHVNKGIIKFKNGGWVYIDVHSRREKEKRADYFSQDFALAIDDKGTIYRLDHRYFDDLEISAHDAEGISDVDSFLRLRDWYAVEEGIFGLEKNPKSVHSIADSAGSE